MPEPWLRGTLGEVDAIRRQVLHALVLVEEDARSWCAGLSDAEMNARPCGVAPVAFHLRHIARSLDRLLTYAEGAALSGAQLIALAEELAPGAKAAEVLAELERGVALAEQRIARIDSSTFEEVRTVGRQHLPTTVGGLLVHCAEHSQRHIGQAITTAQIVVGGRSVAADRCTV